VVGGLEVSDLKAEVFHVEVLLRAERDREGDPTHGVGRLARHVAEEGSSHSVSLLKSKSIFFKVSTKIMLSPLTPSMRV
jgi:hypothetical protein